MGSKYLMGINPFHDLLLSSVIAGVDLQDESVTSDLYNIFSEFLVDYFDVNERDLAYLDFVLKHKGCLTQVIGNNIISALWLSGIFPVDTYDVIKSNTYVSKNIKYTFDLNKKQLIQTII
jgi:hypothetical protein